MTDAPNTTDTSAAVDSDSLRSVLGHFATGVVAITALQPDSSEPVGLAANSFTSVSLYPPLVAFCVAHTSQSWPSVIKARRQAINILSEGQEFIGRQLATRGTDKFKNLQWTPSPSGAPVFDGVAAWLEVEIDEQHHAGDHMIVVSRVHHMHSNDHDPLLFHRGRYGRLWTQ
ncbi:flavin reductase (DIM6/NTAB) family NADH-FMN oxidoreductase RutF [Rhodococcus fascians]|uniref:flavin reductase family protein n=1 Tax=Nocardiaceae TaxID=85025 RepID=UPI00285FF4F2|nr:MULTISPECIES: flavin reductase family protein [Rhodococcus]MDR6910723.1 flavin reductase (DIM6/NTAB) family NADH-FMN oxidoreductase RutF [Rhodococcus sp. 3258]MDR6931910.1 flavin reductase (DIM6/NTAB) family NADH-FMN oxidoreductase RutF [Rhodococcus fascians]